MLGRTVSHYRILSRLGEGGMGVVYRALDLRLDREVVLKFLASGLGADPDARRRLTQEARAASSLDHPNICAIYDIDETGEGQLFIVMSCYEGEDLARRISRGPLPLDEAVDIGRQIASGLAAAHARGIIHRDIKPGNVFITRDGVVKLLDFGLAKLVRADRLTRPGTTLGTVAYMAPEQLRGEDVDERADVWSFGAVLHEMLAGRPPFGGAGSAEGPEALAGDPPESLGRVRPETPVWLQEMVSRALARSPAERQSGMDEVLEVLEADGAMPTRLPGAASQSDRERVERRRRIGLGLVAATIVVVLATVGALLWRTRGDGGSARPSDSSTAVRSAAPVRLAVLPFDNGGRDPGAEYLGFALADRIIDQLGYAEGVLVRPSSSVREYRVREMDEERIAGELQVEYLVTGSLHATPEVLQLTVELQDLRSGRTVWRRQLEVASSDAFKLEGLVAREVVHALELELDAATRGRMEADVPGHPLAYDYYLRSVAYPVNLDGNALALEQLERSVELDPGYAPAWAELGNRRRYAAIYSLGGDATVEEADEAFQRALALNGYLLDALSGLAKLSTEIGEPARACELLRRALEINPDHAESHFSLSYAYRYAGLLADSAREGEIALALDPGNPRFRSVATTYLYLGDLERALEIHRLDPGSAWTLARMGQIHLRRGETQRARDLLEDAIAREPESSTGRWAVAMLAFITGHREEGLAALHQNVEAGMVDGEQLYHIGNVYCLLGELNTCLRLIDQAVEHGFFNVPFLERDAFLDPVRDHPEFRRILEAAATRQEELRSRLGLEGPGVPGRTGAAP